MPFTKAQNAVIPKVTFFLTNLGGRVTIPMRASPQCYTFYTKLAVSTRGKLYNRFGMKIIDQSVFEQCELKEKA